MEGPNPYCETLPNQLRAWDSTTLRTFMECPYKWWLVQRQGFRKAGDNVHLDFGRIYHGAVEVFDKAILDSVEREEATFRAVSYALDEIDLWDEGGAWLPCWQCTDLAFKEGRGGKIVRNTKRCVHARKPQDGHREGDVCPECGRPTVDDYRIVAVNKNKNKDTLLRSVIYYCDTADERVKPYVFPNGTKAVELSFAVPLPLVSPDGTPYLLTGNLDSMVSFGGEVLVRERKTTKSSLSSWFFDRYSPDVQINNYDLAAYVLFAPNLPQKPTGVMVEVTQVGVDFTVIDRQIINIPEERREEWLNDLCWWIKQAEECARNGYWPRNTSACNAAGGCPMRRVCRMAPSVRDRFLLGENYIKQEWNPLQQR